MFVSFTDANSPALAGRAATKRPAEKAGFAAQVAKN